jgi:hypothetical protein
MEAYSHTQRGRIRGSRLFVPNLGGTPVPELDAAEGAVVQARVRKDALPKAQQMPIEWIDPVRLPEPGDAVGPAFGTTRGRSEEEQEVASFGGSLPATGALENAVIKESFAKGAVNPLQLGAAPAALVSGHSVFLYLGRRRVDNSSHDISALLTSV